MPGLFFSGGCTAFFFWLLWQGSQQVKNEWVEVQPDKVVISAKAGLIEIDNADLRWLEAVPARTEGAQSSMRLHTRSGKSYHVNPNITDYEELRSELMDRIGGSWGSHVPSFTEPKPKK